MRIALIIAILTFASLAGAQERPPGDAGEVKKKPAEPPAAAPDRTTETFGDWSIVCSAAGGGSSERACEVDTTIVLRGQTAPFARIALVRLAKDKPTRVIALVPVNVSTTSPVKIDGDSGKFQFGLPIKSCVPAGCLAETDLSKDQLQAFRAAAKGAAQLTLVDASGKSATVQMSFRGLDQALDAYFKSEK